MEQAAEMIKKLLVITEQLEKRANQIDQRSHQAEQSLLRTEKSVQNNMSAVESRIQKVTSATIGEAVKQPTQNFEYDIKSITNNLTKTANEIRDAQLSTGKWLKALTWKVLGALGLASVLVLGVAIYVFVASKQEIKRSDWIGGINAAIANGKLTTCSDGGGICAIVDKKQIRLDK